MIAAQKFPELMLPAWVEGGLTYGVHLTLALRAVEAVCEKWNVSR